VVLGLFESFELLNFIWKLKDFKPSKQMQRHACIQTLGEF
jgi:hypothetical protein